MFTSAFKLRMSDESHLGPRHLTVNQNPFGMIASCFLLNMPAQVLPLFHSIASFNLQAAESAALAGQVEVVLLCRLLQ